MANVVNTVTSTVSTVQKTVSTERTGVLAWIGAHKMSTLFIAVGVAVVAFLVGKVL